MSHSGTIERPATSVPLASSVPWPRRITIRTRLAITYSLVTAVVLVVLTVAVGAVHGRLGMARIDADLASAMRSVSGVVNSEIDERFDLGVGANEALIELELPGTGIAVLDRQGRTLATRSSGVPALSSARVTSVAPGSPPQTIEPDRIRVAASNWQHGPDTYTVVCWQPLNGFDREHETVTNIIRLAIPFAALAALAGGWLFVWRAMRPLSVMTAHADAIDRRHLDARLPVPEPPDDLRRLAVAFNGLLGRLDEAVGSQQRFMTDASHELRTPVTVVRTTAQVTLSAPNRTEAEYREALDIVASQSARLAHIVDDLFLLALADAEGRTMASRYLYLDELVADCVKALTPIAEGRRIRIGLQAADGAQMRGDEELLRRMVTNLLDNAIRHAPDGSVVRVDVALTDGCIRLEVSDDGAGIPETDRERVFERFVRLEASRATAGGGLGLPIARWIAEQHGGSLRLEPSARGSRFVALLPAAQDGLPATTPPAS